MSGLGATRFGSSRPGLAQRAIGCAVTLAVYGLIWGLGLWRPAPHVAWVNAVIIGAILVGTLPPAPARSFTAAMGYLGVGCVMFLVMHDALVALVLVVLGMISLAQGVGEVRRRGARG